MQQSNPDTDIPLTSLCAICHANAIKYTCPRCGVHTCSLACVQKHKRRAQCSGVRDPAAFRKRSELTTPASVDRDFNFITGVERSLNKAEEDGVEKWGLVAAGLVRPYRSTKFDDEVEGYGVRVVRAPSGLSRSKLNRSRWDAKRQCVSWTVEFVLPVGAKVLRNFDDTTSVGEAYRMTTLPRTKGKKRRRQEARDAPTQGDANEGAIERDQGRPAAEGNAKSLESLVEGLHFYLLRPNLPAKYKCLIPLSYSDQIRDALKNRTVLEFPTIYVRREDSSQLAEPFITEDDYLQKYGSELPVSLPTYGAPTLEEGEVEDISENLDSKKVLEVLQQDVKG